MSLNEQYLAGAILLEDNVIWGLDGLVTADDFQDVHCRAIFEAAKAIKEEGCVADAAAIGERARRNGVDLPQRFLVELMDVTPTHHNFAEYARRVAEDARLRRIKEVSQEIQDDLTSSPDELLGKLQQLVSEQEQKKNSGADSFLSLFKPLTDFEEEEAAWLIPGWVPEGQITLIAADGGVGKTTLWCNIIAALSAGRCCVLDPPGYTRSPMKIAFCTTEDSVKKKLRKKLRTAGANMDNIITMDLSADKSGLLGDFKFGSSKMEQFVRSFTPSLCAFDPVQGFIPPKVNMGARNEMRHCMAPMIVLGEDVGTTFLVICHTNKRKGAYGRDRIADSADLWDIARSVIMAGYTESQGVRYLSNEKNNYTQLQKTILFSIDATGQIIREGTSWKRDKEYMLDAAVAKSAPKREDCKDFILNALQEAEGQCMKSDDLVKKAQEYGYAFKTIRNSREDLNKDGITENYYVGTGKRGGRICFIRIKKEAAQQFEELPYEEPIPFTETSA